MSPAHPSLLVFLAIASLGAAPVGAQQARAFQVSTSFDAVDGPSTYPFPGFSGAFRQQVLISSSRLVGLQQRIILGFWVRRDLHDASALQGGQVNMQVSISRALNAPTAASADFSLNAAPAPVTTFTGVVTVPSSPAIAGTINPWGAANSVRVMFTTPFLYSGGDLCVDIVARPVPNAEPRFWFVDCERGSYTGTAQSLGTSCSPFADLRGEALYTNQLRLQLGSSMRLIALGRPGARPMLLIGGSRIPGGLELGPMGAPGCHAYINWLTSFWLGFSPPAFEGAPGSLHFEAGIPVDKQLLGVSFFVQMAEDESAFPVDKRSNRAGLTTSNALELRISSPAPDLGMSIVTSRAVRGSAPMPATGSVDTSMAPVIRFLY